MLGHLSHLYCGYKKKQINLAYINANEDILVPQPGQDPSQGKDVPSSWQQV